MATQKTKPPRPDLRLVRWLGSLVAFAMISPGIWSIASRYYFGRTTKFGGAEISLDGQPAVPMGLLYIALGALPIALWFRTAQTAAWWASACAVAFLALLAVTCTANNSFTPDPPRWSA